MQIFFSVLFGLLLILNVTAQSVNADTGLPVFIRKALDKNFPGWVFPNLSDEIRRGAKEYLQFTQPNLVRGDFDGNGQLDYALQIEQGDLLNDKGKKIGLKNHLVASLKKNRGYEFYRVDANGGGDYLVLWKKGGKPYDYKTQKNFILKNDAFEAVIYEKAGTSYVFEKGKFRAIITGD